MASTEPEKMVQPPEAPASVPVKTVPPPDAPPPEESKALADAPPRDYFVVADVVLRFLLFASTLVAVVVMVTSKQTKLVRLPVPPTFPLAVREAKFNHSPAFIYFVTALSVACLYSIITTALSFFNLLKPGWSAKFFSHFVIFDVLLLGIVAAATGTAGGVAYIGLRGNSHSGWGKVCNNFDKFCQHLGGSIAVSLFASIVLVLLVLLSVYTLSRKIPK